MRSHSLLTFFACVCSALRLEPSAVPFVARLHLLDSCVASAFSKEPDTVSSSSVRAAAGTAVLSSGRCYATPGSGSVSFSVRQVRSDVGSSGRGAAFKLVAFLERYSDASCRERVSRRTLPASAHRVCTRMPSASALANEAWFLLETSPHAAPDEPAAAAEAAPTVGSSGFTFNAPAGGSSGPFKFGSSGFKSEPDGFPKFPGPAPTVSSRSPRSTDRWAPKDPKKVFDDFFAEEARERQRQQRERDAAAEADRRAPTPTRSAAYPSLGDAWKADLASFQKMDRLGLVTCVLIGVVTMGYSWRRTSTTR